MAVGTKDRLMFLYKYLKENTDYENQISTGKLIQVLHDEYGADVERKTLPDDIRAITESGGIFFDVNYAMRIYIPAH